MHQHTATTHRIACQLFDVEIVNLLTAIEYLNFLDFSQFAILQIQHIANSKVARIDPAPRQSRILQSFAGMLRPWP